MPYSLVCWQPLALHLPPKPQLKQFPRHNRPSIRRNSGREKSSGTAASDKCPKRLQPRLTSIIHSINSEYIRDDEGSTSSRNRRRFWQIHISERSEVCKQIPMLVCSRERNRQGCWPPGKQTGSTEWSGPEEELHQLKGHGRRRCG